MVMDPEFERARQRGKARREVYRRLDAISDVVCDLIIFIQEKKIEDEYYVAELELLKARLKREEGQFGSGLNEAAVEEQRQSNVEKAEKLDMPRTRHKIPFRGGDFTWNDLKGFTRSSLENLVQDYEHAVGGRHYSKGRLKSATSDELCRRIFDLHAAVTA